MFERNKIDNAAQMVSVPAEVTLNDGAVLKGRFAIASNRNIMDVLNGDGHFLDFETYEGDRQLMSRTHVAAVRLVNVPGVNHLKGRMRESETFDPYLTLGVSVETPFEEVRAAYLRLSKIYHPDRFHGIDLPQEVRDYLAAMARRINMAYTALEAPVQAARRAHLAKAQPIYTSARRA